MDSTFLWAATAAAAIATVNHAILGERRLIVPLSSMRRGILSDVLVRLNVRLAWHWTTALMALTTFILFRAALNPIIADRQIIVAVGLAYLLAAFMALTTSRGKLDSWAPMAVIGLITLTAQY